MRTTLTLDEDVSARLRAAVRKSGKSFKQVVNDYLRLGLNGPRAMKPHKPFVVRARALGVHPGLDYDNIGELLETLEGPAHR